jgi:lysophospholipase L1-like esterase
MSPLGSPTAGPRFPSRLFGAVIFLVGALGVFAQNPERFRSEITQFQRADATNPPPAGAVLFVGSSSIRLWTNLTDHFPGVRVLNRGFGGSHISDVNHFFDQVVRPYRPRAIVFYAGDNDLADKKSPRRLARDFRQFLDRVTKELGPVPVGFIAIKPSIARRHLLTEQHAANDAIRELGRKTACRHLRFLDVATGMLDAQGRPKPEQFVADGLHLSGAGYEHWRHVVTPFLAELPSPKTAP